MASEDDGSAPPPGKGRLRLGYEFLGKLVANTMDEADLARLLRLPRGVVIGGREQDPLGRSLHFNAPVVTLLLRGPGLPAVAQGELVPVVDGRIILQENDGVSWEFSPAEVDDAGAP